MKIKVVGVDMALRNLGIAVAKIDLDQPTKFNVTNLTLTQTSDGSLERIKVVDGKVKRVKYLPKGVSRGSDDVRRAKILFDSFKSEIDGASIVFAEVPIGSQSARAMVSYGVSVAMLGSCPVPLVEVSPSDVKLAGCNDKTATKQEMIQAATSMFPDAPWVRSKTKRQGIYPITGDNEHLADACFVIKAGMQTEKFKNVIEELKNNQVNRVAS